MKRFFMPLVMMATLLGSIILPYQGQAASELDKIESQLDQLQRKQSAAKNRVNRAEKQINHIKSEKNQAEHDIDYLMKQIDIAGAQLEELRSKIAKVSGDLKEAGQQLDDAINRVETRDQLLQSRLRLMYTNGFVSYMDVLLSSTSFSDFLDRYDALKSIVSQDKDILEANKTDRNLIADKKVHIENQLDEVSQLYAETEKIQETLKIKEKDKQVLIASLDLEEEHLEKITEEEERLMIEFASEERKLQDKKRKIKLNYYKGGKLGYPLPEVVAITSGYGSRVDPITGKKGAFHTGLDLGAHGGTSVLAAEKGSVIVAQWWGGYGNAVIIDHGNGLWTLYGHMRKIVVDKGDTVEKGSKIGEVGSTGRSTGNHLHFEVRLNEKVVSPLEYLK